MADYPRRDIRDQRHGRREIVLQHFLGMDAGFVAPRNNLFRHERTPVEHGKAHPSIARLGLMAPCPD
jgi:hypothetical protein